MASQKAASLQTWGVQRWLPGKREPGLNGFRDDWEAEDALERDSGDDGVTIYMSLVTPNGDFKTVSFCYGYFTTLKKQELVFKSIE